MRVFSVPVQTFLVEHSKGGLQGTKRSVWFGYKDVLKTQTEASLKSDNVNERTDANRLTNTLTNFLSML